MVCIACDSQLILLPIACDSQLVLLPMVCVVFGRLIGVVVTVRRPPSVARL